MKTRIKILVFIGLMMLTTIGYSQTGTVKIITNPSKAIIRLDTTLLKSNVPVQVKPGDYTLKMWSPKRRFYEQKLTVKSDSNIRLMKTLTFEPEYLKYQKALRKYKYKRVTRKYLPIPIFLGLSIYNFKEVSKYSSKVDENYNNAINQQESYNTARFLESIESHKVSYEGYKNAYDENRSKLNRVKFITYSTLAIGTFVSWYLLRNASKLEKPVYQEKTLLSNLEFNYIQSEGSNFVMLTFNF